MAELPDGDPWAPAVNRTIREIEAATGTPGVPVASRAEYLAWEPETESWPMTRPLTRESALLGAV